MEYEYADEIRSKLKRKSAVKSSAAAGPHPKRTYFESKECAVCLGRYTDARQLSCRHSFCVECLQYMIDVSDQNGGFNCVLCHDFVHLEEPDEPKSKWAWQFPADTTLKELDSSVESAEGRQEEWKLDWQLTIYPKSQNRSPVASKTHMKSFDLKKTPTVKTLVSLPKPQEIEGNSIKLYSDKKLESCITATLYVGELILVYDQGIEELLLYSEDGTLRYSAPQQPIYGLALLDNAVYMTNPKSRCIEILQLDNMRYRRAIELTMRCYDIDVMDDSLVVLLSEGHEPDHVTFVGKDGVTGGQINVDVGRIDLKRPRQISVCSDKKLIYVSDEENCVIKCFDLEGDLQWEKVVWNPERLVVIETHLIIGRRCTNTMDVLTHKGKLAGRLESDEYDLSITGIIAINGPRSAIIVIDAMSHLHMFHLRHEFVGESESSCCCIM